MVLPSILGNEASDVTSKPENLRAKSQRKEEWGVRDLNPRPTDYESAALTG